MPTKKDDRVMKINNQKMASFLRSILAVLVLSLPALQVSALETTIDLGAGLEHTSNSLKSSTSERSELEQKILAGFGLNHQGGSVVAEIDYRAEFTAYDKDTQSDETAITGDASIVYEQIDQQLYWTLENSRRNVVRDRALTNIEENREDRSITTISPELILRLSAADAINMRLSYSDISYDDDDQQDSNRAGASASWQRSLSKVDTVSLNIDYQDVSFDTGNNDYEYYRATIGYSAALSRLSYSINIGYNESQRESGNTNGNYFQAESSYQDGSSNWRLSALQELTDTSMGDGNGDFTGLSDFNSSSLEVDVFERTNVELEYNNSALCGACLFSAAVLFTAEDYEELNDDTDEVAFRTSLSYQISRLLSLRGLLGYRDISFKNDNARDDYSIVNAGFSVNQSLTRQFSMVYSLAYEERDSSVASGDYDEWRGGIRIAYVF
ncbi:hypothetical protein GP2143_01260 [marine gamma proteobacterium HTCC2143]|uniref:Uncharacterized protein n=1 Tax=marine gamma proteobacterium HTCC2143 TaxID=247633 RepID=A0YGJ0_9GAMM|nr:hypothetical protein GP2143_01260 [marine gamma proteobacterium HTCC2143]